MTLRTKLVFALLMVLAPQLQAGNESRGTEAEVLLGMSVRREFSADQEREFQKHVTEIRNYIESGALTDRLISFNEQAEGRLFRAPTNPAVPSSAPTYEEVRAKLTPGLLQNIVFVLNTSRPKGECSDRSGADRVAATDPAPGSPICLNPEYVGLFELGIEKINPLIARLEHDLLLGITEHEIARWYNLDQSHSLLIDAAVEARRQAIADKRQCPSRSNLCQLTPASRTQYALDISKSNQVSLLVRFKGASPNVDCFQAAQVVVNGWEQVELKRYDPRTARADVDLTKYLTKAAPDLPLSKITLSAHLVGKKSLDRTRVVPLIYNQSLNRSAGFMNDTCGDVEVSLLDSSGSLVYQQPSASPALTLHPWTRPATFPVSQESYPQAPQPISSYGLPLDDLKGWSKEKFAEALRNGISCETVVFAGPLKFIGSRSQVSANHGIYSRYDLKMDSAGRVSVEMRALEGKLSSARLVFPFVMTEFYMNIRSFVTQQELKEQLWSTLLSDFLKQNDQAPNWKAVPWPKAELAWNNEYPQIVAKSGIIRFPYVGSLDFPKVAKTSEGDQPWLQLTSAAGLLSKTTRYQGEAHDNLVYFGSIATLPVSAPIAFIKKAPDFQLESSRCQQLAP